jgi:hypothetical protein
MRSKLARWICPKAKEPLFLAPTAKQNQARWVYLGFHEGSGERIEGWLVRALNANRILEIAASFQAWKSWRLLRKN